MKKKTREGKKMKNEETCKKHAQVSKHIMKTVYTAKY